jgi:cyanophycinase
MSSAAPAGPLLIIGGAEDKLGTKLILNRFVRLAGGAEARIAVVSTASALGDAATDAYRRVFHDLGVTDVQGLRPLTRADANDEAAVEQVEYATGVFMTGGNQLRLSTVVGDTALGRAIITAHARGAVVGGTSAGASAISEHMVAFGASGESPKQRMVQMSAGLGLLPGVVIDQHFEQRNRIGRLLSLVAHSPGLLGLGIDEDTAALVTSDQVLEVIGRGAVTVVDGSNVESNAYLAKRTEPLLVSGAVLHSLPNAARFDLRTRQLLTPPYVEVGSPPLELRGRRMARAVDAEGGDDTVVERNARRRARRAAGDDDD